MGITSPIQVTDFVQRVILVSIFITQCPFSRNPVTICIFGKKTYLVIKGVGRSYNSGQANQTKNEIIFFSGSKSLEFEMPF